MRKIYCWLFGHADPEYVAIVEEWEAYYCERCDTLLAMDDKKPL